MSHDRVGVSPLAAVFHNAVAQTVAIWLEGVSLDCDGANMSLCGTASNWLDIVAEAGSDVPMEEAKHLAPDRPHWGDLVALVGSTHSQLRKKKERKESLLWLVSMLLWTCDLDLFWNLNLYTLLFSEFPLWKHTYGFLFPLYFKQKRTKRQDFLNRQLLIFLSFGIKPSLPDCIIVITRFCC